MNEAINERIVGLLCLSQKISQQSKYDALFEYSGHVKAIHVYAWPKGEIGNFLYWDYAYLNWENAEEQLERLKTKLLQFDDRRVDDGTRAD